MVKNAERTYRTNPKYWRGQLAQGIMELADWSKSSGKPLVTTECWAIVDYKDWPLLDWGWVKEVCAFGTETASQTGRWLALATSNFCGPQFKGMWEDRAWHRRLTKRIHQGPAHYTSADPSFIK